MVNEPAAATQCERGRGHTGVVWRAAGRQAPGDVPKRVTRGLTAPGSPGVCYAVAAGASVLAGSGGGCSPAFRMCFTRSFT